MGNFITENYKKPDVSVDSVGRNLENLNNSTLDHLNDSNVGQILEVTADSDTEDCNESWYKSFIYLFYLIQCLKIYTFTFRYAVTYSLKNV